MSKSTKVIAALGVVAGLGVAALPAFTYAISTSANAQISVEIEPAIAIAIKGDADGDSTYGSSNINPAELVGIMGPATIEAGPSSSSTTMTQNDIDETMNSIVTVYTNNKAGWTLSVKDADSTTALTNATNDTIPANANVAAGTAAWAYKVGAGSYAAITDEDVQIAEGNSETTSGTATTVTYGVSTSATQATGTYTDVITYTAATKNGS